MLMVIPSGTTAEVPVVCPALGSWEDAVAFFVARGFDGQVDSDGDQRRWSATTDPFRAHVLGGTLAEQIDFDAWFPAMPEDPATGWFWSSVDLARAFETGESLIHQLAHSGQPLMDAVVLRPENQNWPGTWSTAGGDRAAEMTVEVTSDGLSIHVSIDAMPGGECVASSVETPGPSPGTPAPGG
jgi:hypothetical protein